MSRCLAVCIVTPLPALLYTIAIEALLPLAPIADGWDANPNLTIRLFLVTCSTAFCGMTIMCLLIPTLRITRRKIACAALTTGLLHTASVDGLITLWTFPLPFTSTLMAGVFSAYICLTLVLFAGLKPFLAVPDFRRKLTLYLAQMAIVNILLLVYPAYGAFYRSVRGEWQTVCVVLPILLKLAAKRVMVKIIRALSGEDIVPVITQFSVELLHSLFVTTCMQAALSPIRVVAIVVLFDYLPLVFAYQEIHGLFYRRRRRTRGLQVAPSPPSTPPITRQPSTNAGRKRSPIMLSRPSTTRMHTRQALYASENHLLMEYIESALPCVYGIYVAVLFYLPNARYYDTMDTMRTPSSLKRFLTSVIILVALQLLSIVAFSMLLSRRVLPTVSCLHQLSFVLETQAEMVQCWLLTWIPYCILSTVDHGGMDFSLRFEWIH